MPLTFTFTLKKIKSSSAFKNFIKQHKDAELCAGFFVVDYISGANQQQLDYCLPDGKIFTFTLNQNEEIQVKEAETIEGQEKQKLEELDKEKIKIDLDNVKDILEKEMKDREINKRINKIIVVLQNFENKQVWNLNCMLEGMEILQVHINCEDGEILKFEKKSMFDFIKRVK